MLPRKWSVTILILLMVLLVGCGDFSFSSRGSGVRDTTNDKYYHGTEGVRMRFVPGSPPSRLFYYSGGSTSDNEFDVALEVHNVGSSDAIGAVYLSGFSPDIFSFDGTVLDKTGFNDCYFDFDSFGSGGDFWNDISMTMNCGAYEGTYSGTNDWSIRINDIGETLFKNLYTQYPFLQSLENFGLSQHGDQFSFNVGWDNGGIDFMNHGRALVLILSAIDFKRYNGYPFDSSGSMDKSTATGLLQGDNYYFPGGDQGYIVINGHIGPNWPAGLDEIDQTLLATACYGYATYAAPKVCIDPAPFDETRKVCTPRDHTWSGSQGAPVAITSLHMDPSPRKVFLTFEIRNVGSGQVFNPGYLERCSPYFPGRLDSRHKDVVYIGDIRIGSDRLRCSPGYEIRLNNGVGTFTCEYELQYATAKSAYETPVVIELWYGYQESVTTNIHVKRAT